MRSVLRTAVLAAATLFANRARADDGLRLTWFAPAGCPSGEDVKAAALRNVGPDTKLASGALEADAHVAQQTPSSWRVYLRTKRGSVVGEREIEAASCAGVADATAVVLALALVPPTTLGGPAAESGTTTATTAAADPASPPTVALARPDRSASTDAGAPAAADDSARAAGRDPLAPRSFAVGAAMLGDLGALPSPAFGGALHVAWTPGRFRVEGVGRMLVGQRESVAGTDVGADLSVVGLGARACYAVVVVWNLDASPCVGGGFDVTSAAGYNADENLRPTKAWGNLAFGALARARIASWLALRARVEGLVPLYRPNFVVEGTGSVHQPPTIGAVASFGAEVLFL